MIRCLYYPLQPGCLWWQILIVMTYVIIVPLNRPSRWSQEWAGEELFTWLMGWTCGMGTWGCHSLWWPEWLHLAGALCGFMIHRGRRPSLTRGSREGLIQVCMFCKDRVEKERHHGPDPHWLLTSRAPQRLIPEQWGIKGAVWINTSSVSGLWLSLWLAMEVKKDWMQPRSINNLRTMSSPVAFYSQLNVVAMTFSFSCLLSLSLCLHAALPKATFFLRSEPTNPSPPDQAKDPGLQKDSTLHGLYDTMKLFHGLHESYFFGV